MYEVKIELEFEKEPTRQEVIDVIKSDKFWFELVSPPKYDKDFTLLNNIKWWTL